MRDLDSYKNYLFDAVTKLLNTPSPTGYYKEVMPLLKTMAEEVGAKFELTNKGCAVLTVEVGRNGKEHRLKGRFVFYRFGRSAVADA